ncbi:hypothetical protein BDV95DRAFT_607747 [Massariosphaeria phaeospora]|uniref:Methyltransferase domain-containing protein n=1 Tax=Massariosphaeria phaeospora TaxID=100035 RepID=A0A7C8I9E5_9PLEO|nr:hypothetical protein BDV95DRAFT_607747 [Massariosphaeria phaeospora]
MALRTFDPDAFLQNWCEDLVPAEDRPFSECIRTAFKLPKNDTYVYRAQGATTLDITQKAIDGKRANGLHDWYHDDDGKSRSASHPTPAETALYTKLFNASTALPSALKNLTSNAKSTSLLAPISTHLTSRFHNPTPGLLATKSKPARTHTNPYLDLWAYSCRELEWAGPWPNTRHTKVAHHILPIFYHHFACVVPSYAALSVLARLAQPAKPSAQPIRPILDIGSGTGYWTFLLRSLPLDPGMKPLDVRAIDNQISEYRVMWVQDTLNEDGAKYLGKIEGGKGCVLLLVYPQATGHFTSTVMKAFRGDTIVVAGTQTGNGFTGFQDCIVDEWVEKNLAEFELALRMPLPSFAGKDEALFVWQRRKT